MIEVSNSDLEEAIDQWISGRNAERNRLILKRRLIDGICFDMLADEFCLSVRQVKNIVYTCFDRIIKHL